MLKTYFVVFALLFCAEEWLAQVITVRDAITTSPIDQVEVINIDTQKSVRTNGLGQADITDFNGAKTIQFLTIGYEPFSASYAKLEELGFNLQLEPISESIRTLIIPGIRWPGVSKNLTASSTKISSEMVQLWNPQTAADLLNISGEVFIQKSQQGGGSPMIRGFSTNRLLYVVDGVRMNTAIFRAGNIQNVISLDPFAIENTEVVFGPGSVLYGSDAIGGVMSFQTIDPKLSNADKSALSGQALTRFSSANNEQTLHFAVNMGNRKWAGVTSFTYSNYGDLLMGSNGPDDYLKRFTVQRMDSVDRVVENANPRLQNPTGYTQTNLMQKIKFKPKESWEFQYGFHYSETSDYARYDRLIETQSNGLPRFAVWNYGPQVWMMNQLSIAHNKSHRLFDRMIVRLAQQYFEESRIDRRFNQNRQRTNREQVQASSVNVDLEKTKGNHNLFYGAEFVLNDVASTGSGIDITTGENVPIVDRYPASKWSSAGAYVNYQWFAPKYFTLQSGVRFNAYQVQSDFSRIVDFIPYDFTSAEINNNAVSGSLGVVYAPADNWQIGLNASTGFRAPNVDDIGKLFDFNEGEVVLPNPDLSAEYAYNAELNAKRTGNILRVDAAVYYTYLDNAMVRRPFQVNGSDSIEFDGAMSRVYAIQNAAYATVYGFNAGLEIKLNEFWSWSARYNMQVGQEEMEDGELSSSRHAAPAFGTTTLKFRKSNLEMLAYVIYNAEVSFDNLNEEQRGDVFLYAKDENGNPYSPSWYTLNYKVKYSFLNGLTISGGVENITDQRYRPYSSGIVAPGRNLILALSFRF